MSAPLSIEPISVQNDVVAIEPEIVYLRPKSPRPPFWGRWLFKAFISIGVCFLGLGLMGVGILLTLSLIGAPVGIPLFFMGFLMLCLSILFFFVGKNYSIAG